MKKVWYTMKMNNYTMIQKKGDDAGWRSYGAGRFTKETDQLVYNFNASISFDRRLYAQDIRGSIAHVMMLAKQGILTDADKEKIIEGLEGILSDLEKGKIEIPDTYEDIHSFVEAVLTERIGEPRQETSHGAQPERPGGAGYETLYKG